MRLSVLRTAFSSLGRNQLRSGLTVLGIGIGIAAIICTAALGAASAQQVQNQIDNLGEDFLWIRPGSVNVAGTRSGSGGAQTLTAEDAAALADAIPEVTACSPIVQGRDQIVTAGSNWNTRYQGVLPAFFDVRRRSPIAGVLFSPADVAAASRVMVIGSNTSTRLFGEENPVGQTVRMNGFPFKVIGLLAARGADRVGVDRDDVVFVPFTTAFRNLDRRDNVSDVMCAVTTPDDMRAAEAQVVTLLRARHNLYPGEPDDFEIQKPLETIALRAQTSQTLSTMLLAIGSVSLVVAGVGIMNIMLVSVTERSREIGVRLAIGARIRDIRWQFLAEAAALGVVGGALGVGLGFLVSEVSSSGFGWPMVFSADVALGAATLAVGASLIFGYYPAHRASQLDPIVAITAEN